MKHGSNGSPTFNKSLLYLDIHSVEVSLPNLSPDQELYERAQNFGGDLI
jgi:hypothetical protein